MRQAALMVALIVAGVTGSGMLAATRSGTSQTYAVLYNGTSHRLRLNHAGVASELQAEAGTRIPLAVQITAASASWTIAEAGICNVDGGQGDGLLSVAVSVRAVSGRGPHEDTCVPDGYGGFRCIGVGIDDRGLRFVPIEPVDCLLLSLDDGDELAAALLTVRSFLASGSRLP